MTKPSHLARPQAPKLTTPDNGPGYTLSKRPIIPNDVQKQWSSGRVLQRVGSDTDANLWNRLTYNGAELEPYEGRTDANDHMQHGSVVGGKWQPYKAPGLMCVGAAGSVPLAQSGRGKFAA